MNPLEDDIRFDRLVDGELTPHEYRELLQSCEAQPDGWRRCALAFLEAQAWGGHFAALPAQPSAAAPVVARQPAAARRVEWPKLLLAMAASFLLAFSLGAVVNEWRRPAEPATNPPLAVEEHEHNTAVQEAPQLAEQATPSQTQPRGNVTLVTLDGREINLPVYDVADAPDPWGQSESVIPPDVREALERSGHQLRQQRRLIAVPLQNGGGMLAPVDEVEIMPVSQRMYQ